jgi:hypothetical protein
VVVTHNVRRRHADANTSEEFPEVSEVRVAALAFQELVADQNDLDLASFRI